MPAMRVRVLFFAGAREAAGTSGAEIDLAEGATVAAARDLIGEKFPGFRRRLDSVRFAVDREFAGADAALHDGAELAVIPPVSGGRGGGCPS
jgi:MoaE-MoaD fusion protein